jgi:putative transcriptional regulator
VSKKTQPKEEINRLKVVLAEKQRTNKWLAKKLKVEPNTVSRWAKNKQQPSVYLFKEIAEVLEVDIRDLFKPTR